MNFELEEDLVQTTLPANSQVDYWRQIDFATPEELRFEITVIGAGGIGSPVAFTLAKMGCSRMTLVDFDRVEAHNLPNQMYRPADLGTPKVEALAEIIAEFTGTLPQAAFRRYQGDPLSGVVISAVDSMATRSQIWSSIKGNVRVPLYIECRMGGEEARVYALNPVVPSEQREYEKSLYSDGEAVELPCTAQAIIYCPMFVAGTVAKMVQAYAKRQALPIDGIVKILDLKGLNLY